MTFTSTQINKLFNAATCVAILLLVENSVCDQIEDQVLTTRNRINFGELVSLCGLTTQEYNVTTEDGYILGLFRIQGGNQGMPILLVHGIELTSDSYVIRGNNSLGITLARRGHDVWFANFRGNVYSRRNLYLNPDIDKEFWNFSFHENGFYDLPAIIDTIASKTNTNGIKAIAFSQGNTAFLVLGSTRPEYNDMVKVLIYLAPVAYLSHVSRVVSGLISVSPQLDILGKDLGLNEFLGYNQIPTKLYRAVCTRPGIAYAICANILTFPTVGYDPVELGPRFYRVSNYYFPNGSSRKTLIHFGQIGIRKIFSEYDYGSAMNEVVYNSSSPPVYDLSRVTIPSVLLVGVNDAIATVPDAETLRAELPNVALFQVIPWMKMNHLDFIWGRNADKYLWPFIFKALRSFK